MCFWVAFKHIFHRFVEATAHANLQCFHPPPRTLSRTRSKAGYMPRFRRGPRGKSRHGREGAQPDRRQKEQTRPCLVLLTSATPPKTRSSRTANIFLWAVIRATLEVTSRSETTHSSHLLSSSGTKTGPRDQYGWSDCASFGRPCC